MSTIEKITELVQKAILIDSRITSLEKLMDGVLSNVDSLRTKVAHLEGKREADAERIRAELIKDFADMTIQLNDKINEIKGLQNVSKKFLSDQAE